MKISPIITELEQHRLEAVAKVTKMIESLPDNSNTTKRKFGYTIPVGLLSKVKSLDPAHYNFKMQYACICKGIQESNDISAYLQKIISSRQVNNHILNCKTILHDEVVENIKSIM